MPKTKLALMCLFVIVFSAQTFAQEDGVEFEYAVGGAYNVPTLLSIYQDGYPVIRTGDAHYATRPFSGGNYHSFRVENWKNKTAWGIELVHHKLYLENPPSEVQKFDVCGYNLMYITRTIDVREISEKLHIIPRIGIGPVFAHPRNVVRGLEFADESGLNRDRFKGLYLAGATAQLSYQARYRLYKLFHLTGEIKVTGSYASMKVRNGHATVPNIAVHGLFGIGLLLPP
jgi:hypothetical protein